MSGETPEQTISRLKNESRQLAEVLDDVRALVSQTAESNTHIRLWGERVMERLRPALDLVTLIRSRK